jgi:CelD/BcsL family acetyltransferase involved in cellulose biosynthesis
VLPEARILTSLAELAPLIAAWDELAHRSGRPYAAPQWMLAWWRHVPRGPRRLRVVAVHEGGELIGLAPFWARPLPGGLARYRLLARRSAHRAEPLAAAGRASDVARAVAGALAGASPRPGVIDLEGVSQDPPWAALLAEHWPGRRPAIEETERATAPVLDLEGSFDAWFSERRSKDRSDATRRRRRLEDAGGTLRRVDDPAELGAALAGTFRAHQGRWAGRGGSAVGPATELMVGEAARELFAQGRLRVHVMELDGEIVAGVVNVAAGEEVAGWLMGFAPAAARFAPAAQLAIASIRDAFEIGAARFDLGSGDDEYKARLGGRDEPVIWLHVLPAGVAPHAVRLAPERARTAWRRLPHGLRQRIRARIP